MLDNLYGNCSPKFGYYSNSEISNTTSLEFNGETLFHIRNTKRHFETEIEILSSSSLGRTEGDSKRSRLSYVNSFIQPLLEEIITVENFADFEPNLEDFNDVSNNDGNAMDCFHTPEQSQICNPSTFAGEIVTASKSKRLIHEYFQRTTGNNRGTKNINILLPVDKVASCSFCDSFSTSLTLSGCSFCEKYFCASCMNSCGSCREIFCKFCITNNYHDRCMEPLCLDCSIPSVNV